MNLREGDGSVEMLWLWVGELGNKCVLFSEPNALCLGGIPVKAPLAPLFTKK